MSSRPSVTVFSALIEKYVGSDYDTVKAVAEALDGLLANSAGLELEVDFSTKGYNQETLELLLAGMIDAINLNTTASSSLPNINAAIANNSAAITEFLNTAAVKTTEDVSEFEFVSDDETLANNSDEVLVTERAIRQFVLNRILESRGYQGGFDANTNTPDLETPGITIASGDNWDVTVAGTFTLDDGTIALNVGDSIKAVVDNPVNVADWVHIVGTLSAASIKTQYESNADTNAFDDAAVTKLAGIENGATADMTGAEIKAAYEGEADAFDAADRTKLDNIEAGATADQTGAEIKALYEAEADTNAFDDAAAASLANSVQTGGDAEIANLNATGTVIFPIDSVTASITQALGEQTLTAYRNKVATNNANDVVTLPPAINGSNVEIENEGPEVLQIFPNTVAEDLGAGAGTSITLAANSSIRFECEITGTFIITPDNVDNAAIHVDVAEEINNLATATPASDDVIVLEDADDGYTKKSSQLSAIRAAVLNSDTAKYGALVSADGNGDVDFAQSVWKRAAFLLQGDGNGVTPPTWAAFRGGAVKAPHFTAGDDLNYSLIIPDDYKPGTDVYLLVHWGHNGTAISGNMIWQYDATYSKGHDQSIFPAEVSSTISHTTVDIATTPQYVHRSDAVTLSISGGGGGKLDTDNLEPDGAILLNLSADTIPSITGGATEPFLFGLSLVYLADVHGTKNRVPNFYS